MSSAEQHERPVAMLSDPAKIAMASLRLVESNGPAPPARADREAAMGWLAAGLKRFPDHPALTSARATLSRPTAPRWHFTMLRDDRRNRAFEAAIARCVQPGMRVLEIGTGSGLLAMMAAKAGADHVVTCECDPEIAETARAIIAANGFAKRITVKTGMSTDLTSDEIGGRADILVAEVFGDSVTDEGAARSIAHARAGLLKQDAPIMPTNARLLAALADYHLSSEGDLDDICGFDLSHFMRFSPMRRKIESDSQKLVLQGAPSEVFALDFASKHIPPAQEAQAVLTSSGGRCRFVATWLALDLAPGIEYSNAPSPDYQSHWAVNLYALPEPRLLAPGETIKIGAAYDVAKVHLWLG